MKTRQYNNGDTCSVSANPGSHYTFDGWFENDSIVSSDNPYSFTVSGDRTLEGKFTANSYTITTNVSPVSGGSISGGGTYDYGDTCTLTATENPDYEFATWTDGDGNFLSNDNPFSFTVSGDLTVRGVFSTGYNTYTITVISPHGSVSGDGVYALNDTCTLTSTPNPGYVFDHWELNGVEISDNNPYSFTVDGDKTITAVYEVIPVSLKITTNGTSSVILTNSSNQTYTLSLSSGLNEYFGDEPGFALNEITGLKKDSNATNIVSIDASDLTSWINIGSGAFWNCTNLTSITLPNSITAIENSAFEGSGLTSINLPNSLTTIRSSAFKSCSSLTSIVLPDSLIQLWAQAFWNSGLTSLNIPASTTYIGANIINGFNVGSITVNPGNTTFDSRDNCNAIIETATNTLRVGCKNSTIPNTVEIIGSYSFSNISGLTSITLPNSITDIGNQAFYRCPDLTSITLPDSITSIGDSAFVLCIDLTSITSLNTTPPTLGTQAFDFTNDCPIYVPWSADHSVYNSYVSSWSTYSSRIVEMPNPTPQPNLKIITSGPTSVILTNSSNQTYTWNLSAGLNEYTGTEPGFALDEITNLRKGVGYTTTDYYLLSIDASDLTSWTTVENSAFRFLPNLNSIILPDYITSIGSMAFYYCSSLTSITLPNSLTTIDSGAFNDCDSLTSINIPANVSSILYTAFDSCNSLTTITVDSNNQYYNDGNGSNCIIKTSTDTLIQGCKTTVIPNTVASIGFGAFISCTGLTSITLPNSIGGIVQLAFYGCTGLTSITIPASIVVIGSNAFENCTGLTSITCLATTPPTLRTDVFSDTNNCPIYVPAASLSAYQSAWSEYSSRLQGI